MPVTPSILATAIEGVILGTAVGDALGLPSEGLTPSQITRRFGEPPLRHRFILGRGMISDDTEHTCMVAQALLASHGQPRTFARSLAWRLQGWLVGIPAGIGFATLRAILKLWIGFAPDRSGVFSAGNGPAMRSALIGIYAHDDDAALRELVAASTRITHIDPRALDGAWLIALAARHAVTLREPASRIAAFLVMVRTLALNDELKRHCEAMEEHLARGASLAEFAGSLGLSRGVTGYVNHTVPVALYAWLLHHDNFAEAVERTTLLGGDTDTTAAIVGGLMGATLGAGAIPDPWLDGLCDYPRGIGWMRRLAHRLAVHVHTHEPATPLPLVWPALIPRNIVFILVVLMHGLRRLLPPYR